MNHALKTGQRGSTRDIGLPGSAAGKGDASRISDLTQFKTRLDEVELPRIPCAEDPTFTKTKRGFKKVYGKPATKPDAEEVIESVPFISKNEIPPEL
jgi:hypothetical protein